MNVHPKTSRIQLFRFDTAPMRAFHMTWVAFFLCFFAWFAAAPLMAVVRKDLGLSAQQVGNVIIASVAATIVARLAVGWLCDRYGPRRTYAALLALGALPVMSLGLARTYETFLVARLLIGAIGASFVITQYHTSAMFSPNCVGTANATTAGWGNMGGGAAQIVMPLLFSAFLWMGFGESASWRLSMILPGIMMLGASVAYYRLTQDSPDDTVRGGGTASGRTTGGQFLAALADRRVLALALMYGASFGVEITIHNVAALYFVDRFGAGLKTAGLLVGLFGLLALFARTLGGWASDRVSRRFGLSGRAVFLGAALLLEGLMLILFSRSGSLAAAAAALLSFGLFVHVACGATYAVIPFINPRAVGSVAGIAGAGGNLGAVLCGFLFRGGLEWQSALLLVGVTVTGLSVLALSVRFADETEAQYRRDLLLAGEPASDPDAVGPPAVSAVA
jgi:NNP family nitrate/nitrite transporter-like MFS transporter